MLMQYLLFFFYFKKHALCNTKLLCMYIKPEFSFFNDMHTVRNVIEITANEPNSYILVRKNVVKMVNRIGHFEEL